MSEEKKFKAKFRNIFKDTIITFSDSKLEKKLLGGPDMDFWPQQLNFACWCATSGCGISLGEEISENYPTLIKKFYEISCVFYDKKNFKRNGSCFVRRISF